MSPPLETPQTANSVRKDQVLGFRVSLKYHTGHLHVTILEAALVTTPNIRSETKQKKHDI